MRSMTDKIVFELDSLKRTTANTDVLRAIDTIKTSLKRLQEVEKMYTILVLNKDNQMIPLISNPNINQIKSVLVHLASYNNFFIEIENSTDIIPAKEFLDSYYK